MSFLKIITGVLVLAAAWTMPWSAAGQDKKVAVCSTTQIADFTRQIVGDDWIVHSVLGPAQDPHTYEVTVRDSRLVASADLCLHNGWNLEGHQWMQRLAENAGKPLVTCIDGIQPIRMEEEGHIVEDPHAWMDPRNAKIYVENILRAVQELDPDNAERFQQRADLYIRQLGSLHTWIQSQVVEIPLNRRILVTHHDAFAYFCEAYHFRAISPAGWTTEELAGLSLVRRQEVVRTIRATGVRAIFIETSLDPRTIEGIAEETGVAIGGSLYSDAMGPPGSAGETYIGMMRENVIQIVSELK